MPSTQVITEKSRIAAVADDSTRSGDKAAADVFAVITPSGRFTNLDPAKLRGGYYTPTDVARWLVEWAIRSPSDTVLEPSCGDGNLLVAAALRLTELGADPKSIGSQMQGVELSSTEANAARTRLLAQLEHATPEIVQAGDFFGWWANERDGDRRFDAIVGNPPFIRYQAFPEPARGRAMSLMQAMGLKPNRLTNIWVPFVVAATEALNEGGRLALIVPAELLQVSYAAQLRKFLTQRFRHVGIVSCNELFFDGAEQEVVLLLADGSLKNSESNNDCTVAFVQTPTVEFAVSRAASRLLATSEEKHVCGDSEKWLKYFLPSLAIELMRELRRSKTTCDLSEFASVDVGVVTGKNEFFVLRKSQMEELELSNSCNRLVSRSAHLRSLIFDEQTWNDLNDEDERVHLLNLRGERALTLAESRYVEWGEGKEFHKGYKCRIRKPWFQVPSIRVSNGFLFRQIYDFPRAVLNQTDATSTDTIHRLSIHGCDSSALVASTYTYLTAASAEIEGRSYGGGVLELEPTEAERILVPKAVGSALSIEEADLIIKTHGLQDLLKANEKRVLIDGMGLCRRDAAIVKQVWDTLRDRRRNRSRRRPQVK